MSPPLVTVAIPTFNRSGYLAETINSIRAQTVEDIEILILDDASTDGTQELVSQLNDSRVNYRRQSVRVGAIANANDTIDIARGHFYMLVSDDDLISHNYLEEMLALLHESTVRLALGSGCDIDEHGRQMQSRSPGATGSVPGTEFVLQWLDNVWPAAGTPTCLFARRQDLLGIGRFPVFPTTDNVDNAAMMALAVQGDVGLTVDATYYYRRHPGNAAIQFSWKDRVASANAMMDYFHTHPAFASHLDLADERKIERGLKRLLAQQYVWATFVSTSGYRFSELARAATSFPISRQYLSILGRQIGELARTRLRRFKAAM